MPVVFISLKNVDRNIFDEARYQLVELMAMFMGLNNMKILSITDARFDEKFGFTEEEVKSILKAYDLSSHLNEMREWYDGYHFGDNDVYCPWDVINHVDRLSGDPGQSLRRIGSIPVGMIWSGDSSIKQIRLQGMR